MFGTIFPVNDLILDKRNRKQLENIDILSLQLSKEKVQTGSFEGRTGGSIIGNVGYAQGNSEGKPVIYIYTRYRAANMNDDAASAQDSFMDVTPQNPFYRESHGLRFRRRGNNVS